MYRLIIDLEIWDAHYEKKQANPDSELTVDVARGTVAVNATFIPWAGLHLGEAQIITVCQIYLAKVHEPTATTRATPVFHVSTATINCADYRHGQPPIRHFKNIDEAIARVQELLPWENKIDWKIGEEIDD